MWIIAKQCNDLWNKPKLHDRGPYHVCNNKKCESRNWFLQSLCFVRSYCSFNKEKPCPKDIKEKKNMKNLKQIYTILLWKFKILILWKVEVNIYNIRFLQKKILKQNPW